VSQQLQQRLSALREKLASSERALQAYRESKGLVNVGGSAQANSSQQMGAVTERMLQARTRRMELESAYAQLRNLTPSSYGSVPEVVRDSGVTDAQRLVSANAAKVAEMAERLGPEHEQLKQARAELAQAQEALQTRQAAIVRSVTREYEAARGTELALERNLNELRGSAQGVNRDEFQLAVLEREYQSNRQLFEMFMSRAKETSLLGDVQPSMARVTDMAVPPDIPVKPNRRNLVMTAILMALLLGALASIAIDRLDNTIKGSDDAEARLKVPVLATLPQVDVPNRRQMARLFLENTHSHFSEGIRTARTGVMLSSLDAACKVLLVTSAVPGEGKTTVAVNLALALAHAGTKTLLIDADMRRGQTSRSLGQGGATLGLATAVAGTAPLEQCVVAVRRTTLSLLPVGETPPNPLELLHSQKFKDVLERLKTEFQVIIIDSPPLELVSEAQVLAPLVTNSLLVTRAMSTPLPLARKALNRLQRAGGNVLGVVVNGLDFSRAKRYYGEYVASSYSYGYQNYGAKPVDVDIELDAEPTPSAKPAAHSVRALFNRLKKTDTAEQKRA
jgi:succinoglycan biosynthesis transport protein ExoP